AAFALSAFSVFFSPAAASVLPTLVPEDDLVGANSAVWSAAVISQIALAPVAGALVAVAGPGPAFALNAASFVGSAAFLVGLPVTTRPAAVAGRHLADVAAGLRAIRASRFLRVLAGVQGLAALSAGATSALLVVLAEEHLGVGPGRFGLLIAAIGVGAGFGPLVLHRFVDDVRRPRFLYGPYLLRGAVDLVLAASSNFPVALGALGLYGIGTSTGNVTYSSVLQARVPDRLRGRVFASFDVVWQSSRLVSIGAGGFLADRFGVTAVYWAGGALLLAAGGLGLLAGADTGPVRDDPPG
ncbi:MAG: MFS transporter, partial [Acidimicrobiales bacterium]